MSWRGAMVMVLAGGLWAADASAQSSPATPTTSPAATPDAAAGLGDLDRGLRALYAQIEPSLARVLVPNVFVAKLNPDHPLSKWGPELDEQVRRELLEGVRRDIAKTVDIERPDAATQPDDPSAQNLRRAEDALYDPSDPSTVVVPGGERDVAEQLALVVDTDGHVIVPAHVDARVIAQRPLRVSVGGELVEATLVGSDARTQLAVLKLQRPRGRPINLAPSDPPIGSLVLLLAPTRRSMHLEGWIGRLDEPAVVVDAGGSLASFCRPGQTLAARHIRTMAAQIIQRGEVERAVIGAVIGEIALGDPIRHEMPGLGALPATMVMRVAPNSPAAAAGLQRGDVLLSMGGEPSGDLSSFAALLCVLRGPTRLEILRNGRPMQAIIDLRPAANGPATTADRPVGHNAAVPPLQPP